MWIKTAKDLMNLIERELDNVLSKRSVFTPKEDGSYVSEGDIHISNLLKGYFSESFPTHEFISEEEFVRKETWDTGGNYVFVDPIDGTENFVSGLKIWGVGVSMYTKGEHFGSLIYLPEMGDFHYSGMQTSDVQSRIVGLSSSLSTKDLTSVDHGDNEIRIFGCAMYNLLSAARGNFKYFENVKGVNCWDVLPGMNLALELGCSVLVDGEEYEGEPLFPVQKYKIKITREQQNA